MSRDPLSDYKALSSFDQWLVSMNCAVGTASQDQMIQYQAYRDDKYRGPMLDRCQTTRDYLMKTSPGVIFMLNELKKVGESCRMYEPLASKPLRMRIDGG